MSSTSAAAIGAAGLAGVDGAALRGRGRRRDVRRLPVVGLAAAQDLLRGEGGHRGQSRDQQDLLQRPAPLLRRRLALELGHPCGGEPPAAAFSAARLASAEAFSAASAAPAARIGAALSRASAISWPAFSRRRSGPVRPSRERRRSTGWRGPWPRGVHRGDDGGPDRSLHLGTDGLHVVGRLVDEDFFLRRPMGMTLPSRRVAFIRSCPIGPQPAHPVLACMRGSGAHEPDRRNHSRTHFSERQSWRTSRPS